MGTQNDVSRLVVGLGNPGLKYAMTRHNMGYLFVEHFAAELQIALKEKSKFFGKFGSGQSQGVPLHLLLPTTYMNESGRAVRKVIDFYRLVPEQILVVVDDVNLELGQMRLRPSGSAGGHNGLKSIARELASEQYPRLRLGVGNGPGDLSDYVLGPLRGEELKLLPPLFDRAKQIALRWIKGEEIDSLMGDANSQKKEPLANGLKGKDNK